MKKRHSISFKLVLFFVGCEILAILLIGVMNHFGGGRFQDNFFNTALLILLFVFSNFYIVKRIKKIDNAVSKISDGDYDIELEAKGKDEISELEKNINRMTAELKANLQLSKNFTQFVSHEFKTPLAVIRNYAEAAQMSGDPEKTAAYLETIIDEADRLAKMSRTAIELCKIDSTNIVRKEDDFCPAAQIRTIVLALQLEWGAKNIEVAPELEEFDIHSNAGMLAHVFENLISNAVKYTGENGKIDISLKKEDNALVFSVADTGVGISEEDKASIFIPFFTGDKSNSKRDSGLGLPLVKSIAEKLGGSIACESELGKGAVFTVKIPL